jgi:hypothetical protein
MKEENVNLIDEGVEADVWERFEKEAEESGDFFKPELNVPYQVVIDVQKVKLEKKAWKEGGEEKWLMEIPFVSVNDKEEKRTWTTGSFTILNAIKDARKSGLGEVQFFLKKRTEDGKTKYIFENMTNQDKLNDSGKDDRIEATV